MNVGDQEKQYWQLILQKDRKAMEDGNVEHS